MISNFAGFLREVIESRKKKELKIKSDARSKDQARRPSTTGAGQERRAMGVLLGLHLAHWQRGAPAFQARIGRDAPVFCGVLAKVDLKKTPS